MDAVMDFGGENAVTGPEYFVSAPEGVDPSFPTIIQQPAEPAPVTPAAAEPPAPAAPPPAAPPALGPDPEAAALLLLANIDAGNGGDATKEVSGNTTTLTLSSTANGVTSVIKYELIYDPADLKHRLVQGTGTVDGKLVSSVIKDGPGLYIRTLYEGGLVTTQFFTAGKCTRVRVEKMLPPDQIDPTQVVYVLGNGGDPVPVVVDRVMVSDTYYIYEAGLLTAVRTVTYDESGAVKSDITQSI
jgi:hypothetical protein